MSNIIDSIQLSGTVYTIQGTSGGGSPTVELTQAEYDALVTAGTVSADTYYIITDATPADISQYWTSAQTQSAITSATSGKVNTSSVVSSVTSASTDSEIPTAKAVWEAVAGGAVYDKFDEIEQVTAAALNNINDRLSEDEEVTAAGLNALNDNFGGLKLVKLSEAEYNALTTKDSSTLYIIVN